MGSLFSAISPWASWSGGPALQLAAVASADPAPHVRVAAVEAIGAIGGSDAVGILKPLASQDTGDGALAALRVLGATQSDDVVSTLRDAIRSSDSARRLAAVEALASWGGEEAVEPLQWTASADADPAVVRAAFAGLRTIANQNGSGSRSAVRATLMNLSDPARRDDALAVLGHLAPSAIPFVAETLGADDPHLRRGAVEVLGRMTHPAASACLQKALTDADAVVRRAPFERSRGSHARAHADSAMAETYSSAAS